MTDMNGPGQIPMNGASDPAYIADILRPPPPKNPAPHKVRLRTPKHATGVLITRAARLRGHVTFAG
jgi:hypothetical protein